MWTVIHVTCVNIRFIDFCRPSLTLYVHKYKTISEKSRVEILYFKTDFKYLLRVYKHFFSDSDKENLSSGGGGLL